MDYPERWIRGVSNESQLKKGYPKYSLFSNFLDSAKTPGFEELSINWYDEDESLTYILNKCKSDGSVQFKAGAAIFCTTKLDEMCSTPYADECYSYERSPEPDNKYHGNILAKKGLNSEDKKMMASLIAANCFLKLEPSLIKC